MSDWVTSGGDQWGGGNAASFDDTNFGSGGEAGGMNTGDTNDFGSADAGPGSAGSRACFNCGQEGHNKADCPNPRVMRCRHCNQEGHTIARCPDPTCPPQEFTGECRICNEPGHRASDCPSKPPVVCNNCKEEGHQAVDCKNARAIDRQGISDVTAEAAWNFICKATDEKDIDDIKEAVQMYVKANPAVTYRDLEKAFRDQNVAVYLIAIEKPAMVGSLTNMDLQGNLNKKYQVTYRFSNQVALARPREKPFWPKTPSENMERLKDAGEAVDRGLIKCHNCDDYGHSAKNCSQEKQEVERVTIKCFNCGEEGHRVRDCPTPRVDKFACKNCGQSGHKVADCPEPKNADNVECRKCGEMGHFSRDCPQGGGGGGGGGCHNCGQEGHRAKDCPEPKKIICRNCDAEGHTSRDCPEPKNMAKVQCRNCDEFGHESRGCPKPRDYSRVKCSNCGEMGHTKVRCPNPAADVDTAIDGGDAGMATMGGDDMGASNLSGNLGGDWQSSAPTADASTGANDGWGAGGGSGW